MTSNRIDIYDIDFEIIVKQQSNRQLVTVL